MTQLPAALKTEIKTMSAPLSFMFVCISICKINIKSATLSSFELYSISSIMMGPNLDSPSFLFPLLIPLLPCVTVPPQASQDEQACVGVCGVFGLSRQICPNLGVKLALASKELISTSLCESPRKAGHWKRSPY